MVKCAAVRIDDSGGRLAFPPNDPGGRVYGSHGGFGSVLLGPVSFALPVAYENRPVPKVVSDFAERSVE